MTSWLGIIMYRVLQIQSPSFQNQHSTQQPHLFQDVFLRIKGAMMDLSSTITLWSPFRFLIATVTKRTVVLGYFARNELQLMKIYVLCVVDFILHSRFAGNYNSACLTPTQTNLQHPLNIDSISTIEIGSNQLHSTVRTTISPVEVFSSTTTHREMTTDSSYILFLQDEEYASLLEYRLS